MDKTIKKLIRIPIDSTFLKGDLIIPKEAQGIIIFAHGSGSSRLSPRNIYVAQVLQVAGFGTLLFDLLTEEEDMVYETRFDIPLLTERLELATRWLKKQEETKNLKMGYFGASTGAAAALEAGANPELDLKAIVSRGGRPDMAREELTHNLKAPVLMIVGGADEEVIELNKKAEQFIKAKKKLSIIPGATHLFEEEGTLEKVAELAADWFKKYL